MLTLTTREREILAAIAVALTQLHSCQTKTCCALAGPLWRLLTYREKQEFGRMFYRSGAYARLGLAVARRCQGGAAQTYRLAPG